MILPFFIIFIEGIIPVIIKLYMTLLPYNFILLISQFLGLLFITSYILLFKPNEIKEGFANFNSKLFLIFLLIAFFGTFLAKIFYIKTIKDNENISIFIIIMSLYPIITIIASYFLLKERLTYYQIIGYFLIIIGICFLLYKTS